MAYKSVLCATALLALTLQPVTVSAEGNPFGALGDALKGLTGQKKEPDQRSARTQERSRTQQPARLGLGKTANQQVVYEGYSKEMLPVKKMVSQGKLADAMKTLQARHPDADKQDVLAHLQIGLVSLDKADTTRAEKHFASAERALVAEKEKGLISGLFSDASNTSLSVLTGNEELGDYEGAGFERVLILNYKSIAHMLDGERKAYNVTRRAIDLQNIEKKKFDALVREAEEEIKKKEQEQKEKGANLNEVGFDKIVKDQYKSSDKKARSVASAFVNPFGFYMAGVVQELDSYEDPSLRDNARISYQKALELNPKSKVIKQALKDIKKPASRNKRLVQVIVGDGYSPEKKLLKFDLSMGQALPTLIELPLYEAVANRVHRIEVQTTTGKRWSRLSEVADITALALRFQKDAGALAQLRMMTTVIRNVIEGQMWNQATQQAGAFSNAISDAKKKRDEMIHPDMRSWSMLPSRILAARFYVPKTVSRVKIVSYDRKGRVLNSKIVNIDKNSHNLVYARTLDKTIYTAASQKMWVGL